MKKFITFLLFVFLIIHFGCKEQTTPPEETLVKVFGKVAELRQGMQIPIKDAQVKLTSTGFVMIDSTDIEGDYYFEFNLDTAAQMEVNLSVKKSGYKEPFSLSFTVKPGNSYPVPTYVLELDTTTTIGGGGGGTPPGSGMPQTIAYVGPQTIDLKVYGVGGTETAIIVYEVRDSLGFPISLSQRDTVDFALEGPPVLGGAYVSPAWAITNASGRVATTVNSGTIAGVIQIVASLQRESDGKVVKSTPTRVVVNAGLPSQSYFSIGAQQFNFAGYNWVGRTNNILVQVGDKYSNPVHQGTAVYFNTTGGIITAARYTDVTGRTTATLYSGNPLPYYDAPGYGAGYAWVYAQTIGENGIVVKDSIIILFSGLPTISIDPTSINVPRGGSQNFNVNISDQNGNPLAPGTRITATIEFSPPEGTNWSAKVGGLPEEPLNDYLFRGPGKTDFVLNVVDATPDGTPALMPVVVKISVSGSNGNASAYLYGNVGTPTP